MINLFDEPYTGSGDTIVKWYFNSFDGHFFLEVIKNLVDGVGYSNEGFCCHFETWDEEEQPPFEGVMISYMDEDVLVSHDMFYSYLLEACERYKQLNPDKANKLDSILLNQPAWSVASSKRPQDNN